MYNCPVLWYRLNVCRRSVVDEMSVDELSWNLKNPTQAERKSPQKLVKLLSAHKSQLRETSLFTVAILNQFRNSQTSRFVSVPAARTKSGKVKPRRQRGATVAIGDDGGRVVAHAGVESR